VAGKRVTVRGNEYSILDTATNEFTSRYGIRTKPKMLDLPAP